MRTEGIGISVLLLAVGAIMAYAVTADTEGVNIQTAGFILMVIGGIGLVVTLIMGMIGSSRTTVVEREHEVH